MSLGPNNVPQSLDLFRTGDATGYGTTTGTAAYAALTLPAGKKALQISFVTSATATVNIQNSLDKVSWFNVLIATNTSVLAETDDTTVPFWRVNVTAHTTSGTGSSAAMVARIAQTFP